MRDAGEIYLFKRGPEPAEYGIYVYVRVDLGARARTWHFVAKIRN